MVTTFTSTPSLISFSSACWIWTISNAVGLPSNSWCIFPPKDQASIGHGPPTAPCTQRDHTPPLLPCRKDFCLLSLQHLVHHFASTFALANYATDFLQAEIINDINIIHQTDDKTAVLETLRFVGNFFSCPRSQPPEQSPGTLRALFWLRTLFQHPVLHTMNTSNPTRAGGLESEGHLKCTLNSRCFFELIWFRNHENWNINVSTIDFEHVLKLNLFEPKPIRQLKCTMLNANHEFGFRGSEN